MSGSELEFTNECYQSGCVTCGRLSFYSAKFILESLLYWCGALTAVCGASFGIGIDDAGNVPRFDGRPLAAMAIFLEVVRSIADVGLRIALLHTYVILITLDKLINLGSHVLRLDA